MELRRAGLGLVGRGGRGRGDGRLAVGGGLILQSLCEDMAGVERSYRERAAARNAIAERLGELLRAPVAVRWFESVIGYRG